MYGSTDAQFSFTKEVSNLKTAGFAVYAGTRDRIIEGGREDLHPFPRRTWSFGRPKKQAKNKK